MAIDIKGSIKLSSDDEDELKTKVIEVLTSGLVSTNPTVLRYESAIDLQYVAEIHWRVNG